MKRAIATLLVLSSVMVVGGCRTTAAVRADAKGGSVPRVIIPAVTTKPVGQAASTSIVAASPQVPASVPREPRPVAVPSPAQGVPVYIPPKIRQTVLAAYEDEKGRLFGPQIMYEKVEEGRFNVSALEQPDLAYIPPENLVVPVGMGNPTSMAASQRAADEAPVRVEIDSIDPRDIIPTGLLGREEHRLTAERMAKQTGRRAHWDKDLGWLLIPQ